MSDNPVAAAAAAVDDNCRVDSIDDCDDDDGDALIFHITPQQRKALVSSKGGGPEQEQSQYQDFVDNVRKAFDTEGVVVIRGLLDDDDDDDDEDKSNSLLQRMEADARTIVEGSDRRKSMRFVSTKFGPVFSDTSLREAALARPEIPRFVATVLLGMDEEEKEDSLHLLKDAFLAKGGEKSCCGWHVDDWGFWPTDARSRPGVNCWIALDDIPASRGGGLAVSPRSHRAHWRHRAYDAIGSTKLYPEEGLVMGSPLYDRLMKSKVPGSAFGKTCVMEEEDPELARIVDSTSKVFNYRRGDVLFHTRWLFHRSMPLTDAGRRHFANLGVEPTFKRYSIRYDYGDSRLIRGFNAELAVLLNGDNTGKTLAEVNQNDGPFYPKCWPGAISAEEMEEVDRLVAERFPIAEAKLGEFFAKMMKNTAVKK